MAERWKPNNGEKYFYVNLQYGEPRRDTWLNTDLDENRWENGDCFKTEKEAEYAAIKVKDLLFSLHRGIAIDIVTKDALVKADSVMNLSRAFVKLFANDKELQASIQDKIDNIQDKPLPKLTAEVFNRSDCPEWAKYAAVDSCGDAYFYAKKPQACSKRWNVPVHCKFFCYIGKFATYDWQNSLVERPAAKLPDWCKPGAWIYTSSEQYLKINGVSIDLQKIELSNGATWSKQDIIDEAVFARLRPYNAEEMKALVGKVISHQPNAYLCVGFHRGNETVDYGPYRHTEQDLLKTGATIDGKPCGVLEHLENGEWVK